MGKGAETNTLRTNGRWVHRLHTTKGWRIDGKLKDYPKAVQKRLLDKMRKYQPQ